MSEHIRNLIDAIESGKSVDIQNSFEAAMAEKLSDAIEARKEHIASNLFVTKEEEINAEDYPDEDESHGS